MKTINYETRYTKDEAKSKIAQHIKDFGPNESIDSKGLSYRRNGVPGTGD